MLIKRSILIAVTLVMMLTLTVITGDKYFSAVLTFVLVVLGYLAIGLWRNKKRSDLLNESCDPQAFIDATEAQQKITGKKPLYRNILNIDKAAGLMLLGKLEEANELLLSISPIELSKQKSARFVHTINRTLCLYALDKTEEAEYLFETEVPLLSPVTLRMKMAIKLLLAERMYFLNRHDEAWPAFEALLKDKNGKQRRLGILYRMAQMDEAAGRMDEAVQKYAVVAAEGNKLWIAEDAKKRISKVG